MRGGGGTSMTWSFHAMLSGRRMYIYLDMVPKTCYYKHLLGYLSQVSIHFATNQTSNMRVFLTIWLFAFFFLLPRHIGTRLMTPHAFSVVDGKASYYRNSRKPGDSGFWLLDLCIPSPLAGAYICRGDNSDHLLVLNTVRIKGADTHCSSMGPRPGKHNCQLLP